MLARTNLIFSNCASEFACLNQKLGHCQWWPALDFSMAQKCWSKRGSFIHRWYQNGSSKLTYCMNNLPRPGAFDIPKTGSAVVLQTLFSKWKFEQSFLSISVHLLSICQELAWRGLYSTLSYFWKPFSCRRNQISCNISHFYLQFYLRRFYYTIPLDFLITVLYFIESIC